MGGEFRGDTHDRLHKRCSQGPHAKGHAKLRTQRLTCSSLQARLVLMRREFGLEVEKAAGSLGESTTRVSAVTLL